LLIVVLTRASNVRAVLLPLQEKASYKSAFSQLWDLKGDIEHLQLLLEQSRQKLQRDFQQWLGMVARQQQEHQQGQQQQQQQQGMQQDFQPPADQHVPGRSLSAQQQQQLTSTKLDSITSSRPSSARSQDRSSSGGGSHRASAAGSLPRSVSQRQSYSSSGSASTLNGQKGAAPDSPAALLARASSLAGRSGKSLDLSQVDPQVLQAAAPHLTGNAAADEDIIKFYEARAKLLQKLGQQQTT
jgi:kinesin family protein 6/9